MERAACGRRGASHDDHEWREGAAQHLPRVHRLAWTVGEIPSVRGMKCARAAKAERVWQAKVWLGYGDSGVAPE